MKDKKLNRLVKISLLGVIAFIVEYIAVSTPFFPSFLQFDISDLPALIGAFALGPGAGVAIELLKNIFHSIFVGGTAFVGEFANFIVGAILVFTAGYIYNRNKTKKTAITALVIGSIAMTLAASVLNYYLFLPLYEKILHIPISGMVAMGTKINSNIKDLNTFVVWSIAPFNLIKGIMLSVLTAAIYKKVSPILQQEGAKKEKLA